MDLYSSAFDAVMPEVQIDIQDISNQAADIAIIPSEAGKGDYPDEEHSAHRRGSELIFPVAAVVSRQFTRFAARKFLIATLMWTRRFIDARLHHSRRV